MPVFPTIRPGKVVAGALESYPQPALPSVATHDEAQQAVQKARELFGRTLACWAGDLLVLRTRGLHVATWTDATRSRRLWHAA